MQRAGRPGLRRAPDPPSINAGQCTRLPLGCVMSITLGVTAMPVAASSASPVIGPDAVCAAARLNREGSNRPTTPTTPTHRRVSQTRRPQSPTGRPTSSLRQRLATGLHLGPNHATPSIRIAADRSCRITSPVAVTDQTRFTRRQTGLNSVTTALSFRSLLSAAARPGDRRDPRTSCPDPEARNMTTVTQRRLIDASLSRQTQTDTRPA